MTKGLMSVSDTSFLAYQGALQHHHISYEGVSKILVVSGDSPD